MPRKVENIIGSRFGRLVVVENLNVNSHGSKLHRCICDCGNTKDVPISYLKSGHTTSCGCLVKEMHRTHNLSQSRLYNIHQGMLGRCFTKTTSAYRDYGGRGITVCDEWKNDFMAFYKWSIENGYREDLTIDRIDVNGNYEPINCRWVTKAEQSRNSRKNVFFTYNGITKTISEWAREFDIPLTTFRRRISQNRPLEEILSKERLKRKYEKAESDDRDMSNRDYKSLFATKDEVELGLKRICPNIAHRSGIYFYTREENGNHYCYIGKATDLIDRNVAHCMSYAQHIDKSIKTRGFFSEDNPSGWKLNVMFFSPTELNFWERYWIDKYNKAGYVLYNVESGGAEGKTIINERKPPKTYREGVEYGKKSLARELRHIIDTHLEVKVKKDNKISQKALSKFWELLNYENDKG